MLGWGLPQLYRFLWWDPFSQIEGKVSGCCHLPWWNNTKIENSARILVGGRCFCLHLPHPWLWVGGLMVMTPMISDCLQNVEMLLHITPRIRFHFVHFLRVCR